MLSVCVGGRGGGVPSVWPVSVTLSFGSPAAVPPSISASLSVCPVLYPMPASVETTDNREYRIL